MARNTEALAHWRAFAKPFQEKHGFKQGLKMASAAYHSGARSNPEATSNVLQGVELGSGAAIGLVVAGAVLAWAWSKVNQVACVQIPPDARFTPPRSY